jgi:uncharacterized membrane protein HdeD (DUF308 family)
MNRKLNLIASIVELIIGILAILSFAVLATNGENMTSWIVTLLLAIGFVIVGIIGIVGYKSKK